MSPEGISYFKGLIFGPIFGALIATGITTARAQEPPKPTYSIQLTDQQIDGIIAAGAACLEKTPYACAEYAIYIKNLLMAAKQPKDKVP